VARWISVLEKDDGLLRLFGEAWVAQPSTTASVEEVERSRRSRSNLKCQGMNIQTRIGIHYFFGSIKKFHLHPNNDFGNVTQYQYSSDVVFDSIQCQGLQYQRPNEA
jgi:hypothetical protein